MPIPSEDGWDLCEPAANFQTPADGTCVIDIFIPVDSPGDTDTAKWYEIARATRTLLGACVVRPNFNGGYITGVGTYIFTTVLSGPFLRVFHAFSHCR